MPVLGLSCCLLANGLLPWPFLNGSLAISSLALFAPLFWLRTRASPFVDSFALTLGVSLVRWSSGGSNGPAWRSFHWLSLRSYGRNLVGTVRRVEFL